MHFLKLADVDLGINRGCLQLFMPEQLLDISDVRPAFEHVRGARMPQHVAASFACEPCFFHHARDHARKDIGIEWPAVAGQEHRLCARVQAQARANFQQVFFHPLHRSPTHRKT